MFSSFSFSVTRTASVVYIREKQTNIVFYRKVSAYNLEKKLFLSYEDRKDSVSLFRLNKAIYGSCDMISDKSISALLSTSYNSTGKFNMFKASHTNGLGPFI